MSEAILGALIALFAGAAVLGRIQGRNAGPFLPVGDRVAAGMIAACLLLGVLKGTSPGAHPGLALGISAPLVFYSIALTLTDLKSWFTWLVLLGLLAIFMFLAALG